MNRRVRRLERSVRGWPLARNFGLLARSLAYGESEDEVYLPPPEIPPESESGGAAVGRLYWQRAPNPLAGSEFVYRNLEIFPVTVFALFYRLITSAVVHSVANQIGVRDAGGALVWFERIAVAQAQSVNRFYVWSQENPVRSALVPLSAAQSLAQTWLPMLTLMPNWTIETVTNLNVPSVLDAGDQFLDGYLMLREERR